ncbi:HXXEE domain-containing protein [Lactiplantibacillus plantarum]|uniref:HXXEE domain-containing protein n=1 Tax=Lactiplantibacillus plantarum TaxID=1590 RepID=UPI0007B54D23|nr:HXXEE domain-containing protein [Lactiplantibacillus plantarum]MCG0586111.1 integral membrane protein [Lactiplantibacillus plantarum]MCG0592803.1 integral membrane protein [Lactiplantibacillus plantarum]MCG0599031.1 integral membrane protein [Lactiplantibacillus plantarum]MCG0601950.1 integral membrane protein [Lactiplantibacillus plantarum]MCG0604886.1 integral membrane protein [Lactiplantibacillus plantarum]
MHNFSSYWILPLIFMFHDFEELVFVPYWLKDHNPKIHGHVLFGGVNRSDILAAGIWEEFCMYLLLATVAYIMDSPLLVATATLPYLFHLIMHLVFVFNKRTYVPGAITATIELPIIIVYLYGLTTLTKASLWEWIIVVIIMFVSFISNLKFIHWIMAKTMHKLS